LTLNLKDLPPGSYRSTITLTGDDGLPVRQVPVELKIADVAIAPLRPILFDGWHGPYRGRVYKEDFKAHGVNVLVGSMSKADRERWGYRIVKYNTSEGGPKRHRVLFEQHHSLLERMRVTEVGFDECIWRIGDEGSGIGFLYPGKLAKQIEPRIPVSYNPGPVPGLAAFKELDPYTTVWYPYVKHFNYPKRVAIFSAKPYLFYTVNSGRELSAALPGRIYRQVRSVPARPGNCLGTGVYTAKRFMRDPWDTAYQVMPADEGVFMYPSRHGAVPTRTWEAARDAAQHANLAVMLKEKAAAMGMSERFDDLVANGSVLQLLTAIGEMSSN
jgi:hypothetical protein